ncbi:MAG: ATP-binding cassette domain-containing protein [Lachnospiraceae bacterium]|nr:ATP-binding cassette domain-containing protein [Lachnospiraceae bacterium]
MSLEVCIKKTYKDFSLDVSFGTASKRIGILGASGSGKSLTLKSTAGLVRPDEGSIVFDDVVLFDRKTKTDIKPQKRNVGYLFQDYALFPDMTVEENIRAAFRGRKKAGRQGNDEDVESILKKYGLLHARSRLPKDLSGGEKQRTALARMLACDPGLLLLDEPFSAMDAHLREGMRLKLAGILEEYDRTFILVSHDRDEIYQLCDYLVLMQEGKVIAKGRTEEVFAHPGTVASARLTGCKNISRIEIINDHRVRAIDWNGIELATGEKTGGDITHIGIRAHDLHASDSGENVISCGSAAVSKLPFEWYVTLENGLWWKVSRGLGDNERFQIPEHLIVPPEKILLLKN